MSVVRQYVMISTDRDQVVLRSALEGLASKVARLDGCTKVALLQDAEHPSRFVLQEHWVSREAHGLASENFEKDDLARIMSVLATPAESTWLQTLQLS